MPCIDFYMLGSGSASHPYRGTSSILLDAGMGPLLVDAGCTSVMMLRRLGYDPGDVTSVIVTHGHVDHYCGLQHIGFIKTWRSGSARRLSVYTTRHASRLIDYSLRSIDRSQLLDAAVRTAWDGMEVSGFKVGLIPAVHTVEALSLELVHDGVRILVSGDTAPTGECKERAQDAAIAIHEATRPSGM
ncbi:MAG: MBL fold metallo-hydrolase, partial [Desulfurococcales archaeon]|nr:MBL fold metallo-hydrolase [Desulfurococcales archaeon]